MHLNHIHSIITVPLIDASYRANNLFTIYFLLCPITRKFCVLHNLMIEYLRQPIDGKLSKEQYFILLNKTLIEGYYEKSNGKWSTYPDDGYYYQYLIYHALQAKDGKTLKEIIRDFKWISVKIHLDSTIYNLCVDMEKAIDYLKSIGCEVYYEFIVL